VPALIKVKLCVLPFPGSVASKVPSGFSEDRKPVVLSTPMKRPEVMVYRMGKELRENAASLAKLIPSGSDNVRL
jgi:hypothetical protein